MFDVTVVGAGYSGSLISLLLTKLGYRVALLEKQQFPKFAIGEATIPELGNIHDLLGTHYGIPELSLIASYSRLVASGLPISISPKELYYYLFDSQSQDKRPVRNREIFEQARIVPGGPDFLVFRQDLDLYLANAAIKRGTTLFCPVEITKIALDDNACISFTDNGSTKTITSRFLIDASGGKKFLVDHLGIGSVAIDSDLRTRSIFSHFTNVGHLEDSLMCAGQKYTISRDSGVKHIINDFGWFWIIPFNNGITSVGMVIDQKYDEFDHENLTPKQVFDEIVANTPAVKEMLQYAAPVRPFVRTDSLQWQAEKMYGKNWLLVPPSSGAVDVFLSPGMALCAFSITRAIDGISTFLRGNDPAEQFEVYQKSYFQEHHHLLSLMECLYAGMRNYDVFCEVHKIFLMAYTAGTVQLEVSGANGVHQLPLLWGGGNKDIVNLIQELRVVLKNVMPVDSDSSEAIEKISSVVEKYDRMDFMKSPRITAGQKNVYLTTFRHYFWLKYQGRIARKGPQVERNTDTSKIYPVAIARRIFVVAKQCLRSAKHLGSSDIAKLIPMAYRHAKIAIFARF